MTWRLVTMCIMNQWQIDYIGMKEVYTLIMSMVTSFMNNS